MSEILDTCIKAGAAIVVVAIVTEVLMRMGARH
jgi:hypothetical protein